MMGTKTRESLQERCNPALDSSKQKPWFDPIKTSKMTTDRDLEQVYVCKLQSLPPETSQGIGAKVANESGTSHGPKAKLQRFLLPWTKFVHHGFRNIAYQGEFRIVS